jgi:hypothetical protein
MLIYDNSLKAILVYFIMEDKLFKNKIKSLLLKGFTKEEITQLLQLDGSKEKTLAKVIKECESSDISESSIDYYSDMQKDLSKLVFTEMNKKDNKDPAIILQAIKLQAELQEKKIIIERGTIRSNGNKLSKQYSYDIYEEMARLKESGMSLSEIASKYDYSVLTIERGIDIIDLRLPEHLKVLNPSVIQETKGLDRELRLKLLEDALNNKYTKDQMRTIVNKLKGEGIKIHGKG